MSIRSSVGTVRGCLGHFLAMSLPNSPPCWDVEAAGGGHHEHQVLCWDSFKGAWATSYNVFAQFLQCRDLEAAGGPHHEHQELSWDCSRVLGPLLGNVFAQFPPMLGC